jgi:hypothetical protein
VVSTDQRERLGDDALAGYWKFHHGIDLRREPRP